MSFFKKLFVYWVALTSSVAATALAEQERITTTLSAGRITIHAVEDLEVLQSDFDPGRPMGAFLDLELRLQVEGNLCGDDMLAFEVDVSDTALYPKAQEYDLFLRSMYHQTDSVHLTRAPCPLISVPMEVTAPLHIEVYSSNVDSPSRHWRYHLQDAFLHHATLDIQLDAEEGWSMALLPPEENRPKEEAFHETPKVFLMGTLTDEGVECLALRTLNGVLYTLVGDLSGKGFEAGDTVYVVGTITPVSFCMQGTTVAVDWIGHRPPLPGER